MASFDMCVGYFGTTKGRPSATHCSEARNVTWNHIVFQIIGPPRCADDLNKHKHSVQLLTCVFKVACLLDLGLVLSLPVVRREPTTPPRFWVSRRVRRSCCPTAPRISAHVAIYRGLSVLCRASEGYTVQHTMSLYCGGHVKLMRGSVLLCRWTLCAQNDAPVASLVVPE